MTKPDEPTVEYASIRVMDRAPGLGATLRAWFGYSPRSWSLVSLGAICGLVSYATSFPHGLMQFLCVGSIAWLIVGSCLIWPGGVVLFGIDYLVRMSVCLVTRRSSARDWRWYAAGFILAATILAWRSDWLLRWRFEANRPALAAVAAQMLQVSASAPAIGSEDLSWPWDTFALYGKQVGDYHIVEVAAFHKEQVVFLRTGGFFRSGWSFLYDPNGCVTGPLMRPVPLDDGWFTFSYAKE